MTATNQQTSPNHQRASHPGGCPCAVCQGERVTLERCLAVLVPELTGAR